MNWENFYFNRILISLSNINNVQHTGEGIHIPKKQLLMFPDLIN